MLTAAPAFAQSTPLVLGEDALAGKLSVRALVKEVASQPTNPTMLYNFAATLERLGRDSMAAQVYMRALDFETEGSEEWAETVAAIFGRLQQPECDSMAKPVWWDDSALLDLSQRVLKAAPKSPAVCVMRADVLAGPSQGEWPAAAEPRSAEQLSLAGRLYLSFANTNEQQGQPAQQVAVLRQLATTCAKRALSLCEKRSRSGSEQQDIPEHSDRCVRMRSPGTVAEGA